jgi:hypothetical protein
LKQAARAPIDAVYVPCAGQQRGLTLFSLVLALIPLVLIALLVMKILPVYYEHKRIQVILRGIDESGQTSEASDRELRAAFERRADVDDIKSVSAADLVIDKEGSLKIIHVDYEARVPLIEHVALLIDFSASSRPVGSKP